MEEVGKGNGVNGGPKKGRKTLKRADGLVPVKDVDLKRFSELAFSGSTIEETAAGLGMTYSMLRNRLKRDPSLQRIWVQERARLKETLRKKQIHLALQGDRNMLIWLGKNLLDQSGDPVESTVSIDLNKTGLHIALNPTQRTAISAFIEECGEMSQDEEVQLAEELKSMKDDLGMEDDAIEAEFTDTGKDQES